LNTFLVMRNTKQTRGVLLPEQFMPVA